MRFKQMYFLTHSSCGVNSIQSLWQKKVSLTYIGIELHGTKGGKHEVGSNGEKCAWASLHSYILRPKGLGHLSTFNLNSIIYMFTLYTIVPIDTVRRTYRQEPLTSYKVHICTFNFLDPERLCVRDLQESLFFLSVRMSADCGKFFFCQFSRKNLR